MSSEHFDRSDSVPDATDPIKKMYPMVDENETPLPRRWSNEGKFYLIGLTQNNLRVHYNGPGKFEKDAASVRANHPIPPSCGLYYFEVRIYSKGREGYMGIGLSTQSTDAHRLPGWDKNTYGYHGDDGHSYCNSSSGKPYGPTFATGDVIGCGVNLIDNYCFYTRNGHYLGVAFTDLVDDLLYPTVGLQTPGEIMDTNFGQSPFVFDIGEMILELRRRMRSVIRTYPVPDLEGNWHTTLQRLVSTYLVHNAYCNTAEAFSKSTNIPLEEDINSIRSRQKIQKLILAGRMGEAVKTVQDLYPGFLERKQNLLFRLKIRQFIELVNGTDSEIQGSSLTPSVLQESPPPSPISSWTNGKSEDVQGPAQHTSVIQSTKSALGSQSGMATTEELNLRNALHDVVSSSSNGTSPLIHPSTLSSTTTSSVTTSSSSISHPADSDSEMECVECSQPASSDTKANGFTNGFASHVQETVADMEEEEMDVEGDSNPRRMCGGSPAAIERMLDFGRDLQLMSQRLRRDYGKNPENKKMLKDAFSLLAYNDPWNSPVGWQLDPSQREPVYQELNSAILESCQKPRRPPLETCCNHARKLIDLMSHSAIGLCAFVNVETVLGTELPPTIPKPVYSNTSSMAP